MSRHFSEKTKRLINKKIKKSEKRGRNWNKNEAF